MRVSSYGFISILLLVLLIQVLQAHFWGPPIGQCWGRFERYSECVSACPETCDDIRWRNPGKICALMCTMGCDCIPPFVRLNQNPMSPCIHPRDCPFI